jgi:hypothetical protein
VRARVAVPRDALDDFDVVIELEPIVFVSSLVMESELDVVNEYESLWELEYEEVLSSVMLPWVREIVNDFWLADMSLESENEILDERLVVCEYDLLAELSIVSDPPDWDIDCDNEKVPDDETESEPDCDRDVVVSREREP